MNPPNLFNYATSELTQDAFLAYLLAWANPAVTTLNPAMHRAGTAFLHLLLSRHGVTIDAVSKLDIRVQVKNIDVLVYLETGGGKSYALVIEDKVHAGSYNDLPKYLAAARTEYPEPTELLGIYLRTGNQADYTAIENEHFKVINRHILLNYLQDEATGNPPDTIFQNYRRYLENYQSQLDAYKNLPVVQWDGNAWVGFFSEVLLPEEQLRFDDYNYVANRSGGFQGCWWSMGQRPLFRGYTIYLQIDGSNTSEGLSRLAIKMETMTTAEAEKSGVDRIELIRALADKIQQQPNRKSLRITRPRRLSAGKWMTAAEVVLKETDAPHNASALTERLRELQQFVLGLSE